MDTTNMMSQYDGIQGWGAVSQDELQDLHKALSAGTQNPPVSGGNVLRVESLESTLKAVSFQMEHIRLWKQIPKIAAISTVEEYNRLLTYGNDAGAFFTEGGLPRTEDTVYERKTALVKFLGTTREVTHPMTLVKPAHGDVIALETQNGTMWLLNKMERALFLADSSVISQEFDGIDVQIISGAPQNVIDLEGNVLTETDIEQGANIVAENYGMPTHLHLGIRALSDLSQSFYAKGRFGYPADGNSIAGFALDGFRSSAGRIIFEPNVFIQEGGQVPAAATSPDAPAAPTGMTAANITDATSKLAAGTYVWSVTAVNADGESAPFDAIAEAIATGEHGLLTVTAGAGTGLRFYRRLSSDPVGSGRFFLQQPIADLTVEDRNFDIPGTSRAYLVQGNVQNFSFKQLSPMVRIPLATIAAAYRWMQLLYGMPIVYTPAKNVIYKNIGSATTTLARTGFETSGV